MIDPMQIKLARVLYQERLDEATQARRRATWVTESDLSHRFRLAVARCLIALGRQMQASATPRHARSS